MRACAALLLALALPVMTSCRWQPARSYQVASVGDAERSYSAVKAALREKGYAVQKADDAARAIRVRAHIDENTSETSWIDARVDAAGKVVLVPSGHLVKADGTIHKKLANEIEELEELIAARLKGGTRPPPAQAPAPGAVASGADVPHAWSEPAYDPATWGPGDFTCLPVKVATQDQPELSLRLSNGETADVVLSIAYAPELCRSAKECPFPDGCPALGIGDPEQVNRLAARLSKEEVSREAVLLKGAEPVVTIDLGRHGSVAQALSNLKSGSTP